MTISTSDTGRRAALFVLNVAAPYTTRSGDLSNESFIVSLVNGVFSLSLAFKYSRKLDIHQYIHVETLSLVQTSQRPKLNWIQWYIKETAITTLTPLLYVQKHCDNILQRNSVTSVAANEKHGTESGANDIYPRFEPICFPLDRWPSIRDWRSGSTVSTGADAIVGLLLRRSWHRNLVDAMCWQWYWCPFNGCGGSTEQDERWLVGQVGSMLAMI